MIVRKTFVLSVFVVFIVLSVASFAFAHGGHAGMKRVGAHWHLFMDDNCFGHFGGFAGNGVGRGAYDDLRGIELPRKIRDKQAEMNRLRDEIGKEIARKPIDRPKIEALFKKRFQLRDEISKWFVKQHLDALEKAQR